MNEQFEGSLTPNFKVICQGHVICFNIFKFYDPRLKTTPTSSLYHIYINRYLDKQTMVKTVHLDNRRVHLTS